MRSTEHSFAAFDAARRRKAARISTCGRKAELVKRRDRPDLVAAVDEDARVAREAFGVAGDRRRRAADLLAASARACASAPARGGSNSTASKRVELGAGERPAEEVARLGVGRRAARSPRRRRAAAPRSPPRRNRRRRPRARAPGAARRRRRRRRDRRRARAPCSAAAAPSASARSPASSPAGSRPAAASPARRRTATSGGRRSTTISPWTDTRARSSRSAVGDELAPRQRRRAALSRAGRNRARRASPSPGCRAACSMPRTAAASALRGGDRAGEAGREQRAGVDGDDVVGARAHEADLLAAVDEARVEGRAAPALAMGVDQRPDLGLDAGALQARARRRRASTSHRGARSCAAPRSRRSGRNRGRSARRARRCDLERDDARALAVRFGERRLAGQRQGRDGSVRRRRLRRAR